MNPAALTQSTEHRIGLGRSEELDLLARLITDDAEAWRRFVSAYGRLVTSTISRVLSRFGFFRNSEDIREIHASFCLEILANDKAKLRAFRPDRGIRLSTWIGMLASHSAYDFLRRRRREPQRDECDTDAFASEAPDPFSLCELRERTRLVEAAVRDFTAKDREFLELYYGEGLEADQVARRMGISVKTVYSKKHKIQGRLEALLDRRCLAA
jgi:RNA polymerase sigma-70 factor (ECF subfamily)